MCDKDQTGEKDDIWKLITSIHTLPHFTPAKWWLWVTSVT